MKKQSITFLNFGVLITLLMQLNNSGGPIESLFADTADSKRTMPAENADNQTHAAAQEKLYAAKLGELPLSIYSQIENSADIGQITREAEHCRALVYRTLYSLPKEPVNELKSLTLIFSQTARRGLGGGSTIHLRCQNVTDEELVSVLVHEIGHVMDTGVMDGSAASGTSSFKDGSLPVFSDDNSVSFYRISFSDEQTIKPEATDQDFVSGYAKTDPFEDFAETYAYYVLHGDEFRKLAEVNSTLNKKYLFMKYFVFGGKEYLNGDSAFGGRLSERNYDVTVLGYNLDKFFAV